MNKNKIKLLALALLGVTATASAQYTVIYGDKQINGDNIRFVSQWLNSDALISNWVNVGSPTGCGAWSPDPSTKDEGITFDQTAVGCSQVQTRTVQEREQNNVSHEYRNVGPVKNENQTLTNQSISRQAVGTKTKQECGVPNSSWVAGSPSYALLNITWNGVLVSSTGDYAATEKVAGGFKYIKNTILSNSGFTSTWSVCRIPV